MIDYVIMRADQRVLCTDVRVMRGATCWSDHNMLRVKLKVTHCRRIKKTSTAPIAAHMLHNAGTRGEYQLKLDDYLDAQPHSTEKPAEYNWGVLKEYITSAAEETLGRGKKAA